MNPGPPQPDWRPAGWTNEDVGTHLGWGTGAEEARAAIARLDRDRVLAPGFTLEMARRWRDFYRSVAECVCRNLHNPSASGRAELMDALIRLLEAQTDVRPES